MNIFKKLSLYFQYKKAISQNKEYLFNEFNIKIDFANRMYTVINVPDTLGEPYNMRKSDIDRVSEEYMKDYLGKLRQYLDKVGISEMYGFYQPIKKLDKFSYLIILGYKFLPSTKVSAIFWYFIMPTSFLTIAYLINTLLNFI